MGMRFKSRPFENPVLDVFQECEYDNAIDNLGELDTVDLSKHKGHGYLLGKFKDDGLML